MKYISNMRTLLLLIAFFAHVSTTLADDPGATASLDLAVLEQAKDVLATYITNSLKDEKIPDINFHLGRIHNNTFRMAESTPSVNMTVNKTENAVVL